jgi:hypothetical protein
MVKYLIEKTGTTIERMMTWMNAQRTDPDPEDETTELLTGLENTLRVMMVNATEKIRRTEPNIGFGEKGFVQI